VPSSRAEPASGATEYSAPAGGRWELDTPRVAAAAPPAIRPLQSPSSAQPLPRYRAIAGLALGRFRRPSIAGNPSFAWRAAWYLVNALLFQSPLLGLVPAPAKALLLRGFGAKVGAGFVCKPRVSIKSPWFLEIGDHVWLGERVWIDNHCTVAIGSNVCVSQGVAIFTGNHDWSDPGFAFFAAPVEIGDGSWVTAFQRLGPGTKVPPRVVVR
jgi:putative colanic acid biosynthesis acetyltransferase WcaF